MVPLTTHPIVYTMVTKTFEAGRHKVMVFWIGPAMGTPTIVPSEGYGWFGRLCGPKMSVLRKIKRVVTNVINARKLHWFRLLTALSMSFISQPQNPWLLKFVASMLAYILCVWEKIQEYWSFPGFLVFWIVITL